MGKEFEVLQEYLPKLPVCFLLLLPLSKAGHPNGSQLGFKAIYRASRSSSLK